MAKNESPSTVGPSAATRQRRRTAKVSEAVAREILHDIVDGGMEPGARLPSESEMAAQYNIARASLREALRILEIHGLIRIKPGPGGGPVVAPISSVDLGETLTFFLQASRTTFREVMTARLILEPIMARLAAERSDDAVKAELQAGIDRGREVLGEGDEQYLQVTTDFHGLVSGASGNSVLDLLARSLKDIYVARVRSVVYGDDERARLLKDHEVIAEAILSGDGDRAESLMREHMEEYVEIFEGRFTGFMDETIDWF